MIKEIDLTNCPIVFGRAYNGANGKKIAIDYEGTVYMLKFPPLAKDKSTELSYTNSCYSEHIASSIFNLIGVEAHETFLGTYTVGDKKKVVCACKDFTSESTRLFDFCSIKNTVLESSESNGSGTELSEILDTISKQNYVSPLFLEEHFWKVFVVDALLGNFDRHNGNWGFLFDEYSGEFRVAPVYDCGSCLLPQADDIIMNKVLNDKNELYSRIYTFPASIIKINGKKINYRDFLMSAEYSLCNDAIRVIVPKINIAQINEFIDNVPYITNLQREFYKYYIEARYNMILVPALELVNSIA